MTSAKQQARLTAILILGMAVIAPIGMMLMPHTLLIPGDIAATINNIAGNSTLFALGITCDMMVCLMEIAISVLIYRLFATANKTLALVSVVSRLLMTAIQSMNVAVYAAMPKEFGNQATVSMLLNMHDSNVLIWQVFFGFHLLTLGILAYRSGYLPKLVALALAAASLGYLADSFTGVWALDNTAMGVAVAILLVFSTLGELAFACWLLVKGISRPGIGGTGENMF